MRQYIRMTALAIATAALATTGSANADAMFHADAAHTGVYASPAVQLDRIRWRFHAKGAFFSSPTVSNGAIYIGSDDGSVYAIRSSNGSIIWKHQTQGRVRSTPAIGDGRVYVSSLDGNIYALDANDGRELWHFATGGERRYVAPGIHGIVPKSEMMPDPFDTFLSSPTLSRGIIYVGSGDHSVYALNAATGMLVWKFATGNVVHASPTVANGVAYVGSWDRYLYALDAATGSLRWKFATGDDRVIHNQVGIQGSAAVAGGVVYFGARDSHLYALNAKEGRLRWKHDEHGSWVIGTPAIKNGVVYYTTSDEKKLFAPDAKTGAERFRQPYSAFSYSSPSIAGNAVYYGTFDGVLFGVNAETGALMGRFLTDGARAHRAAHLDGKGNIDLNTFYPDSTLDGITVGLSRIYELGSLPGSPAIADGTLYIGDTNGVLYAIY